MTTFSIELSEKLLKELSEIPEEESEDPLYNINEGEFEGLNEEPVASVSTEIQEKGISIILKTLRYPQYLQPFADLGIDDIDSMIKLCDDAKSCENLNIRVGHGKRIATAGKRLLTQSKTFAPSGLSISVAPIPVAPTPVIPMFQPSAYVPIPPTHFPIPQQGAYTSAPTSIMPATPSPMFQQSAYASTVPTIPFSMSQPITYASTSGVSALSQTFTRPCEDTLLKDASYEDLFDMMFTKKHHEIILELNTERQKNELLATKIIQLQEQGKAFTQESKKYMNLQKIYGPLKSGYDGLQKIIKNKSQDIIILNKQLKALCAKHKTTVSKLKDDQQNKIDVLQGRRKAQENKNNKLEKEIETLRQSFKMPLGRKMITEKLNKETQKNKELQQQIEELQQQIEELQLTEDDNEIEVLSYVSAAAVAAVADIVSRNEPLIED